MPVEPFEGLFNMGLNFIQDMVSVVVFPEVIEIELLLPIPRISPLLSMP